MNLKKILIFVMALFTASILYAENKSLDDTLRSAAEDIANELNEESRIFVDVSSSLTNEMSSHILSHLSSYIKKEKKKIEFVIREKELFDAVEKEILLQSYDRFDPSKIVSVGKRYGANFIVFVNSINRFPDYNELTIYMLNVEKGTEIPLIPYKFSYDNETAHLLNDSASYRNVAIGFFAEANKNSLDYIAPAAGIQFDYAFVRKFSMGLKVTASFDFKEKDNSVFTAEPVATLRFYLVSPTGEPVSGLFLEPQGGVSLIFVNSELKYTFNAGLGIGFRMPFNNFYIEPFLRGGYPYLFGAGIAAGFRF